MKDSNSSAFYHSSLGVRTYDLFNERAGKDGVVRGELDFYVTCAGIRWAAPRVSHRYRAGAPADRACGFCNYWN
jgi:hypothetical protein